MKSLGLILTIISIGYSNVGLSIGGKKKSPAPVKSEKVNLISQVAYTQWIYTLKSNTKEECATQIRAALTATLNEMRIRPLGVSEEDSNILIFEDRRSEGTFVSTFEIQYRNFAIHSTFRPKIAGGWNVQQI